MPRITPPPDLLIASSNGICQATLAIQAALDGACEANAVYLTTAEKEAVLLQMPALQARLFELNCRILACADDVADAHGARNVGDFIAHETHQAHGTLARDLLTARELDTIRPVLQAALREGRVNLAQSVEIARALHALPKDLDASVVADAERVLVEHAERFTPHDLRRLGKRIIDVVAPEISEAVEGKRLADEERSARERQKLTLRPQGDGTTRITGLLTDLCANRLASALNAISNPRRDHLTPPPCGCVPNGDGAYADGCGDLECPGTDKHDGAFDAPNRTPEVELVETPISTSSINGERGSGTDTPQHEHTPGGRACRDQIRRMSTPHRNARALNTLLETLDPRRLPLHGGDATTVIVTISLDTLKSEIGTATLATERDAWHNKISAGEARRLACNAGILPAVLGGESLPLDLGRAKRFHSPAQRKAVGINHPYCFAENCRIPATWCEAHHRNPWQLGGKTDLKETELLCSKHHHWVHDPAYHVERLAYGVIRFTRRR